jgi:hypothetical protein
VTARSERFAAAYKELVEAALPVLGFLSPEDQLEIENALTVAWCAVMGSERRVSERSNRGVR